MAFYNQRITGRELSRLVRRALAHPMTRPALPSIALNYFVFQVPNYIADRDGLTLVAEMCQRELASHTVDGTVANRFILLVEPSKTGALLLSAHALGKVELERTLREECPRSESGLSLLLPYPRSLLCIRTQWDAEIEYDDSFTFGRESDNDLIVKVAGTSRRHGQVAYVEGTWKLLDLSSKNGTMLNDTLISEQTELHPGDVVSVASRTLFTVVSMRDWLQDLVPPAQSTSSTQTASTVPQTPPTSSLPKAHALDPTVRTVTAARTRTRREAAATQVTPAAQEGPKPDHSGDTTNPLPERHRPRPALDVNADDLWADYDANRQIDRKEKN